MECLSTAECGIPVGTGRSETILEGPQLGELGVEFTPLDTTVVERKGEFRTLTVETEDIHAEIGPSEMELKEHQVEEIRDASPLAV
jgi:hypothetical protein